MSSTEIIQYWVRALGMTMRGFAKKVQIPASTLQSRIDRRSEISFDELARYASILGIEEKTFMFPEGEGDAADE